MPPSRIVRVGVDHSPPYSFLSPDGTGRGLAVDLINEAARRRGIKIRWIPLHNVPLDTALAQNMVDLWPVVGITEGRLRVIHITKPWFRNNFCLFSRQSKALETPADAAGRSIAYPNLPLASEMARKYLPKSDLVPKSGTTTVVTAVCRGEADAGFLESRTLDAVLLDRPEPCRSVPFSIHFVRNALSSAGIGAQKGSAAVADLLYEEILNLVSDGTFSDRVEKWSSFSAGEMRSLFTIEKTRERSRNAFWGSLSLLVISFVLCILVITMWHSRRNAERARIIEAIRGDVLRRLARGDPQEQILGVLAVTFEIAFPTLRCAVSPTEQSGSVSGPVIAWLPILNSAGNRLGVVSIHGDRRSLDKEETEALERTAGLAAIVLEHKKLVNALEYEATHDRLTGLANRSTFTDRLKSLEDHRNPGETSAVFFIDLDRFKQINDGFGHRIGDLYLQEAADRIRSCFSTSDLVARMGGDEFTATAAHLPGTRAAELCGTILERFRQPFVIEGFHIFGSVSIGVSSFPQDGLTAAEIQCNADAALYAAKELGRNQFQIYSPEMRSKSANRIQTRQLISFALDAGLFELFYQPQIDARGELIGMEALVRLLHPERGIVSPDEFIPVAEEAGLIGRIDSWVMTEACRQYGVWRREGIHLPRIAVNTSRMNLVTSDLVEQVAEALRNAEMHPGALQIELTESAAMTGGETSVETLRQLRKLGVSLALDDFGTGYSSLSCLHQLPVDTVKIDKSFVRCMEQGAHSAPLVEAVIAAAKALGMRVAAEGVETADQLQTLSQMGCDTFQGYYISEPVGVQQATKILTRHAGRLRADAAD